MGEIVPLNHWRRKKQSLEGGGNMSNHPSNFVTATKVLSFLSPEQSSDQTQETTPAIQLGSIALNALERALIRNPVESNLSDSIVELGHPAPLLADSFIEPQDEALEKHTLLRASIFMDDYADIFYVNTDNIKDSRAAMTLAYFRANTETRLLQWLDSSYELVKQRHGTKNQPQILDDYSSWKAEIREIATETEGVRPVASRALINIAEKDIRLKYSSFIQPVRYAAGLATRSTVELPEMYPELFASTPFEESTEDLLTKMNTVEKQRLLLSVENPKEHSTTLLLLAGEATQYVTDQQMIQYENGLIKTIREAHDSVTIAPDEQED